MILSVCLRCWGAFNTQPIRACFAAGKSESSWFILDLNTPGEGCRRGSSDEREVRSHPDSSSCRLEVPNTAVTSNTVPMRSSLEEISPIFSFKLVHKWSLTLSQWVSQHRKSDIKSLPYVNNLPKCFDCHKQDLRLTFERASLDHGVLSSYLWQLLLDRLRCSKMWLATLFGTRRLVKQHNCSDGKLSYLLSAASRVKLFPGRSLDGHFAQSPNINP